MMARRQDLDDIKDSRSRVEHMHYHMHMGNKAQARDEMAPSIEIRIDQAHEYKITKSERLITRDKRISQ